MIQHVLRAQQFGTKEIRLFLQKADEAHAIWKENGNKGMFSDSWAVNYFFQPSTRTHASGGVSELMFDMRILYDSENAGQFSSAFKGETLADTVRTFEAMIPDPRKLVIFVRHNQPDAAEQMAKAACGCHIINAGCGKSTGQHPTQALLDFLTIFRYGRHRGEVDISSIGNAKKHNGRKTLKVCMVGDLRNGRTVRSLSYLLTKGFPWVELFYYSPQTLQMGDDILQWLDKHHMPYHVSTKPKEFLQALHFANIVYMTRIQEEDLGPEDKAQSKAYQQAFQINRKRLALMRRDAIIMHPFPRGEEITPSVDNDERAVYFKQIRNGVVARLALLMMLLQK